LERWRDCDLIAGDREVADDDVLLRELRVEQGLEVAVVLHPIAQRVADQSDVASGVEIEVCAGRGQAMLDQASCDECGKRRTRFMDGM
jgi:hypothetical protein